MGVQGTSTMNQLRDRFYGCTIDEYVEKVPNELPVDAVGLWQIVSFGRQGFGLSGDELTDFVRRCLSGIFARGAKPVQGALDGIHVWTLVPYGDRPAETIQAIVEEWKASGHDPDPGGIWFALPHVYSETLVEKNSAKLNSKLS
jgi:hypothetical protein